MDVVQLISLVFEKKCPWDKKEKNYHYTDFKRRSWEDISEEMDIAGMKLKSFISHTNSTSVLN